MDFVTETAGVKAERQQMKSVRCKKDVGARRDGERIGQRWMKRARGMCISICLHFIRPSVSISLCLSLSGLAHCPWLLRRSLTLMEFEEKEAREKGGEKKKRTRRSGALLPWPPSLSAMFTVSIAYRSTPPRDHPHRHTHTTQRYLRVRHMHTWTRARRCLRFFSKGGMR